MQFFKIIDVAACMDIILLQTLPDHTTKINTSFFPLPKHFFSQFSPFMQSDKKYLMYFEKWHRQFMGTNFTRAHGNVQHDSGWILIFNFITWFLVISFLTINNAVKTTTGVKPLQETWNNKDLSLIRCPSYRCWVQNIDSPSLAMMKSQISEILHPYTGNGDNSNKRNIAFLHWQWWQLQ